MGAGGALHATNISRLNLRLSQFHPHIYALLVENVSDSVLRVPGSCSCEGNTCARELSRVLGASDTLTLPQIRRAKETASWCRATGEKNSEERTSPGEISAQLMTAACACRWLYGSGSEPRGYKSRGKETNVGERGQKGPRAERAV